MQSRDPATTFVRVDATFAAQPQLDALESLVASNADAIEPRFLRARCLDDLGRPAAALEAYLDVLAREPAHRQALLRVASLFLEREHLDEARAYGEVALRAYPSDAAVLVSLGTILAAAGDTDAARIRFHEALTIEPNDVHAHLRLATLAEGAHDRSAAEAHYAQAFPQPLIWVYPYRGTIAPVSLLLLSSPSGGDVVSHPFLDDRFIEKHVMLPEAFRDGADLPKYHVIFNGIGDVDRARSSLERARAVLAKIPGSVINDPAAVLNTAREDVMSILEGLPGVTAPRTARLARAAIDVVALEDRGFTFPLLIRAPGHHMGNHFAYVASEADLDSALARLPGDEAYVIAFIDTRADDGYMRKYRAIFVDGCAYPSHLAVSSDWKVHYFSADALETAAHQREEAAFLQDMPAALGLQNMAALERNAAALALDYGGVDFGIGRDGTIVVFEANATMAVFPPPPESRWDDRRAAVTRIVAAVHQMIAARAVAGGYRFTQDSIAERLSRHPISRFS